MGSHKITIDGLTDAWWCCQHRDRQFNFCQQSKRSMFLTRRSQQTSSKALSFVTMYLKQVAGFAAIWCQRCLPHGVAVVLPKLKKHVYRIIVSVASWLALRKPVGAPQFRSPGLNRNTQYMRWRLSWCALHHIKMRKQMKGKWLAQISFPCRSKPTYKNVSKQMHQAFVIQLHCAHL